MAPAHFVVVELIMKTLKPFYKMDLKLLQSSSYGVAQHRQRLYIVGIRIDCAGKFYWPAPTEMPPLRAFLDAHRPRDPVKGAALLRLADALAHIQEHKGVDPFSANYVIDYHTGRGPQYRLDMTPTITANRASGLGYFHTKSASKLQPMELARLQGCRVDQYDFSGLSRRQIGLLVGNAMTVSVMRSLVPQVLAAAGLRQ